MLLQRDLGNTLCKTDNLIDALDRILKAAVHIDGVDTGGIFLVDSKTGQLDLTTSQGMSSQFLKSILGQEKSLEVVEPRYVSRSEIDDSLRKLSDYEDLTAIAIVPVLFEDKTVAILSLGSYSHDEIPITDRHTLEAIAIQIGAYMARVRAQEAIIQSQSEMMRMFDSFRDLFFVVDRSGTVLHANNTASVKMGVEDTTLDDRSILDFFNKEYGKEISEVLQEVKHGEVIKIERPLEADNGTKIAVSTRIVRGQFSGEDVVFLVSREIQS